jgi:hypothetical protein
MFQVFCGKSSNVGRISPTKLLINGETPMKHLLYTVAAAALATGFALPAAAMGNTVNYSATTCAEFLAMTPDEQSAAMEAMHMASDSMASEGMATEGMATEGMESDSMATEGMATEGMESDSMATEGMATEGMESDSMASEGMASDGMATEGMMTEEMTALISACDGHPDMMVMDAMMSSDK